MRICMYVFTHTTHTNRLIFCGEIIAFHYADHVTDTNALLEQPRFRGLGEYVSFMVHFMEFLHSKLHSGAFAKASSFVNFAH